MKIALRFVRLWLQKMCRFPRAGIRGGLRRRLILCLESTTSLVQVNPFPPCALFRNPLDFLAVLTRWLLRKPEQDRSMSIGCSARQGRVSEHDASDYPPPSNRTTMNSCVLREHMSRDVRRKRLQGSVSAYTSSESFDSTAMKNWRTKCTTMTTHILIGYHNDDESILWTARYRSVSSS